MYINVTLVFPCCVQSAEYEVIAKLYSSMLKDQSVGKAPSKNGYTVSELSLPKYR